MPMTIIRFARSGQSSGMLFAPASERSGRRRFGAISLLIAAMALHGAMVPARAANKESTEYYQEAQEAIKAGNANEAVIHLKNAVRADPDNLQARVLLGQFNLRRGDAAGAEKEFREARKRGLTDVDVLMQLGQAMMVQGKSKEVLAEITTDSMTGASKVAAHTLRARAHLAANDIAKAKEEMDAARPEAGKNAAFHAADADVLQREGDYPAAEKAVDTAIALDPKFSQALWMKGELRRSQRDLPGAIAAYSKALEFDDTSMQVLIGRAFAYLGLNRLEEAEKDIDAVLTRAPQMPMALYLKATILGQRGETEKALEAIQPVEFRLAGYMPAVYLLANLNLKLDRLEGAVNYAERFMAANPNSPEAVKLLSAVYLRQKRLPEAIKILQPHEADAKYQEDKLFLQILGNTYLALSDFPSASRVFKTLQKLDPENTGVKEQLAITSLGLGEQDEAVQQMEALTGGEGGSDRVNIMLVLTHMRKKEFAKAEEAALNFTKKGGSAAIAHNLLGSVYLAQDKRAEARASFNEALKLNPAFGPATLNLSQLERLEKRPEKAKSLLMDFLAKDKNNERALTQLADILITDEKDMAGAVKWLQQAADGNPKSEQARLRLIDLQVRLKKPEAALRTATELGAIAPDSPAALNALAQMQILNNQLASGISTYRKLVSVAPTAPMAQLLLGRSLAQNKNFAEAKLAFNEAIKLAPNMPEARGERVSAELQDAGPEAALKLATQYRDEKPDNPFSHALLGDTYMRAQKFDDAVAAYDKALQLNSNGATFRRLYVAKVSAGKQDEAFNALQEWVSKNQEDWETRMVLSTELIRRGDTDAAIKENESLNEKLPGRPVILNNLGWLYARKGDPRGTEMVRTAYELAPDSPEIQDTFGWLLVKEGKLAEGLEILKKAAAALPNSAEVQYHLAAALAQSGKKTEAHDILVRILGEKTQFDERKDAETLLGTLKAG